NELYFTATNGSDATSNYIYRVHYTVSAGNVTLDNLQTLYSGTAAGEPRVITLDTNGGFFYIGNTAANAIYRGSLTGSGALTQVFQYGINDLTLPRGVFFLSAPTVTVSGNVLYSQGGPARVLASGLSLANTDGQNLASATVSIAGGTAANGETLAATT